MINLPYNERLEKKDDGTTATLPNLMRLQSIEEVYEMYEIVSHHCELLLSRNISQHLKENGEEDLMLKPTVAKEIIKLIAPTRRKNLTCVDEKVADGMRVSLFVSILYAHVSGL